MNSSAAGRARGKNFKRFYKYLLKNDLVATVALYCCELLIFCTKAIHHESNNFTLHSFRARAGWVGLIDDWTCGNVK